MNNDLLSQNVSILDARKQQLETDMLQIEAALESLQSTTESFEFIGNILIKKDTTQLQLELNDKKNNVKHNLEKIESQISSLLQSHKNEV